MAKDLFADENMPQITLNEPSSYLMLRTFWFDPLHGLVEHSTHEIKNRKEADPILFRNTEIAAFQIGTQERLFHQDKFFVALPEFPREREFIGAVHPLGELRKFASAEMRARVRIEAQSSGIPYFVKTRLGNLSSLYAGDVVRNPESLEVSFTAGIPEPAGAKRPVLQLVAMNGANVAVPGRG